MYGLRKRETRKPNKQHYILSIEFVSFLVVPPSILIGLSARLLYKLLCKTSNLLET